MGTSFEFMRKRGCWESFPIAWARSNQMSSVLVGLNLSRRWLLNWTTYVLDACFESCYEPIEIVHMWVVVELSVISVEVHPHPMFLNETFQISCLYIIEYTSEDLWSYFEESHRGQSPDWICLAKPERSDSARQGTIESYPELYRFFRMNPQGWWAGCHDPLCRTQPRSLVATYKSPLHCPKPSQRHCRLSGLPSLWNVLDGSRIELEAVICC